MIPAHSGPVVRVVAAGVLVAVAVAASMLALTTVILPGSWVGTGLVGIALVSAVAIGLRVFLERRRESSTRGSDDPAGSVLPTLAGCAAALWYFFARFGSATGGFDVVVGGAHVRRTVERIGAAGEIVRSEVAPVPGSLPVALLAVGGTLLVLLLADALAAGLRRPSLAGTPMFALWCPPLVLTGRVPGYVFIVTVAALLLLLTLDEPVGPRARRRERPEPAVRRAEHARSLVTTGTAAVVAAIALVVGGASSAIPGAAGGWHRAFTTTGDTIRLSEDLDILRSLTERSNQVVLRYTSASGEDVGPFRSYTATAFDGRRWQRGADRTGRDFDGGQVIFPAGLATGTGDPVPITVTVGELRDDKLPVPVEPRRLAIEGSWGYDEVRDEVVGDRTEPGQVYELVVHERRLSPEVLRAAPAPQIALAYTELPTTPHLDDIAQMAREVAGRAPTAYDGAVALQQWFRDARSFTYATELPRGSTGDPVWDFLQHRTGYCLQFATTMVVMARTLDIPARLAVGHLPGTDVAEGTWAIHGDDSHAWPELYFEGVGWVRFEPTPSVQTGAAPTYTNPALGQDAPAPVPTGGAEIPPEPAPQGVPDDAASTARTTAGSPGPSATGLPGWSWVVAGVGGVAVLAGAVLLLLRRRTVPPLLDPERAWQQVVGALAEEGISLPPPTTLRQAPDVIAAQAESRLGAPLREEVLEDLVALADAAEAARYAREPAAYSPVELEALTASVTAGLAPGAGRR